jgi:hypothetical protein
MEASVKISAKSVQYSSKKLRRRRRRRRRTENRHPLFPLKRTFLEIYWADLAEILKESSLGRV